MNDNPQSPLLALSALSEKATAGPWFIGRMLNPANAPTLIGDDDSVLAIFPGDWNHCTYNKQDAEFIAALVNWFRVNTETLGSLATELPKLPEPGLTETRNDLSHDGDYEVGIGYTADQMRAYATEHASYWKEMHRAANARGDGETK